MLFAARRSLTSAAGGGPRESGLFCCLVGPVIADPVQQVAAGRYHTVGLKSDGTVVAAPEERDLLFDVLCAGVVMAVVALYIVFF